MSQHVGREILTDSPPWALSFPFMAIVWWTIWADPCPMLSTEGAMWPAAFVKRIPQIGFVSMGGPPRERMFLAGFSVRIRKRLADTRGFQGHPPSEAAGPRGGAGQPIPFGCSFGGGRGVWGLADVGGRAPFQKLQFWDYSKF